MPMLKTPIAILIMLLFFDSITCTGTWPGSTGAACLAGISISSQKTGIECSRFPCDQNPHNFAGVWEFRTESLSGAPHITHVLCPLFETRNFNSPGTGTAFFLVQLYRYLGTCSRYSCTRTTCRPTAVLVVVQYRYRPLEVLLSTRSYLLLVRYSCTS